MIENEELTTLGWMCGVTSSNIGWKRNLRFHLKFDWSRFEILKSDLSDTLVNYFSIILNWNTEWTEWTESEIRKYVGHQ